MTNSAPQRQGGRAEVAGRIGVRQCAAEGAAVSDLGVGEVLDGLGDQQGVLRDQGVVQHVVVRGHGADLDRVAAVADTAQRIDAARGR